MQIKSQMYVAKKLLQCAYKLQAKEWKPTNFYQVYTCHDEAAN